MLTWSVTRIICDRPEAKIRGMSTYILVVELSPARSELHDLRQVVLAKADRFCRSERDIDVFLQGCESDGTPIKVNYAVHALP